MPLTNTIIDDHVRVMLGSSILGTESIEWSSSLRDTLLRRTLRQFNRSVGLRKYGTLTVYEGISRYVMEPEAVCQGIIDVQFPRQSAAIQIDEFHILEQSFAPNLDVQGLLATRYRLEQMRNAIGTDFTWEQRWEMVNPSTGAPSEAGSAVRKPVLYIHPVPRTSTILPYQYIVEVSDVADIPSQWEEWILDMVLAEAKIVIGGARRRFDSDLKQDGSTLVTEGQSEKAELVERASRAMPLNLTMRQF